MTSAAPVRDNWCMTQRKPPGVSFETWIDRQIQDATARGEFDNLPGAGKPIPDLGKRQNDMMWWVSQKMRKENLSWLPPTLALRKRAEDALAAAQQAKSEDVVRKIITEINEEIRDAIRKPASGPPLNLMPYDVEKIVAEWRRQRAEEAVAVAVEHVVETESVPPPPTRRWWRRRRKSG